ncbi:TRAP transporter small permease subunit [Jannaschia sp. M317]|uniref:TRAP transporter small permease subunit n=1 Tax=Jannaschia sp. M317 TaxID=2867011 RepID=UPI0021A59A47|nr:TRAP transporter small permease [Jannaschia sp. M317]UWQ16177.1 TRAP transporter small permease [Jannaschia sp. M317]
MATAANVRTDNSRLSRIDQFLYRIEGWLALIAGLAILSLMGLAVVSVGGRNFVGIPLPGYVDWIEQIMPAIALLGIAYTQRTGSHIRLDLIVGNMKGRPLWIAEWVTTLIMLILTLLLVWGTWSHFLRSFDLGQPLFSRDSSIDIGLPIWPAKLVVPVALMVLALRLSIQLVGFSRGLRGDETPVAVPLVESAADQAAAEAAAMEGGQK